MALQDLTPQLRTRLSRMEQAVGWFVILAAALLVFGFAYYLYNTAERKGWFITKMNYETSIGSGAGLKVGDPVKLMGFDVGEITSIIPNGPYDYYNITVGFRIKKPYYGYLWSDSKVKVAAADLLGHRFLEVTKGIRGVPTIAESTNREPIGVLKRGFVLAQLNQLLNRGLDITNAYKRLNEEAATNVTLFYTNLAAQYWLEPLESPTVTERLDSLVSEVENALPNIFNLTNQLATVLSNSTTLTSNLNVVAVDVRPAVSNLSTALTHLDQPGALGEWLLPTNINQKLDSVLGGADIAMAGANSNLTVLVQNLSRSLDNLASMTSNLNSQVQANTNILSEISRVIVDADDFVQGLKHHWLLRSAFKHEFTNAPPSTPVKPLLSPKQQGAN